MNMQAGQPTGAQASLQERMDRLLHDPELCQRLIDRLARALEGIEGQRMRFMEVCGTHTVSIFQSGLRSMLPESVVHLSGPGCPVCVTHDSEVAAFIEMAGREKVIIATFGDLLRVPGPGGRSLKHALAEGARVKVVYSPLDALALARDNPGDLVVFLGIGFETTAPAVAGTLLAARMQGIKNFSVFPMHKLVPPALTALLSDPDCKVDAFLLPGHVAMVTGLEPYRFLAEQWRVPGCVGGFEPADILLALCRLAESLRDREPRVENAYPRAVGEQGNPRARELVDKVYEPKDALWRGLGMIPASGLGIRAEYADMDALQRLGVEVREVPKIPGCRCGDVLKGIVTPRQCPLFGKACTPLEPVGPCMVSTEGSCAAYYKYSL